MAFRTGLLIGVGVGYVLGAKAGRQRYEDILGAWHRLSGSPAMQRVTERTKEAAGEGAKKGLSLVQQGVEKAGSAVRNRLDRSDEMGPY